MSDQHPRCCGVRAEPVVLSTGEVVAHICPICRRAGERPAPRPVPGVADTR